MAVGATPRVRDEEAGNIAKLVLMMRGYMTAKQKKHLDQGGLRLLPTPLRIKGHCDPTTVCGVSANRDARELCRLANPCERKEIRRLLCPACGFARDNLDWKLKSRRMQLKYGNCNFVAYSDDCLCECRQPCIRCAIHIFCQGPKSCQ